MSDQKPIIVKNYVGRRVADATMIFQDDANIMAAQGYYPISQSWSPGSYGFFAFLIALILCFVIFGIFIFFYLLIVPPDGSLAVTYSQREPSPMKATEEVLTTGMPIEVVTPVTENAAKDSEVLRTLILIFLAVAIVFGTIISVFSSKPSITSKPIEHLDTKPEVKNDLQEVRRKEIFRTVLAAEDRADADAQKKIKSSEYPIEYAEAHNKLSKRYKEKVAKQYAITEKQLQEISIEGLQKKWDK